MSTWQNARLLISTLRQWLPASAALARRRSGKTVHVLFSTCDHYEPGTGSVDDQTAFQRVTDLLERYPALADKHLDSNGNLPTRTWFFPPHYHKGYALKRLVSLCQAGYGEVELHLHHGKHAPDTSENLRATILQCIDEYRRFGIFGRQDGRIRYGFIHGDWALNNSRGGHFCGVDDELDVLVQTGCYADFTFPSRNEANPRRINRIFYASPEVGRMRRHDDGEEVRVGGTERPDLMLVQGPLFPYAPNGRWTGTRACGDVINGTPPVRSDRIDRWIETGISVQGREEWVIVKTHTHGATDDKAVLGAEMDEIFTHLETHYNDGRDFVLHYVTARELYNIIKAAEAGEPGANPALYRDYVVTRPVYDPTPDIAGASELLRAMVAKSYQG